jgi:hypothetical protein
VESDKKSSTLVIPEFDELASFSLSQENVKVLAVQKSPHWDIPAFRPPL